MKTFFVSDWHLRHENVIKFDKRPYCSADEMNKAIISRTNERVKRGDRLVYGGDMVFGQNKIEGVKHFIEQLHCEDIYYVRGNHDGECFYAADGKRVEKGWSYQYKEELIRAGWLKCIEDVLHVKWTRPHWFVSHYGHRVWPDSNRGTIHLYGHSHHNMEDDIHALSMDGGCNGNNEYPYSEEDIQAWMNMKTPKKVDHH